MLELNKQYNIDVRDGLKLLDPESIDCCITSPPYWSLRDYGIPASIWDGDPECEHDFSLENYSKTEGYSSSKRWQHKEQMTEIEKKNIPMEKVSQGSFCLKCGAWKGTLGLEPNFELFIKHLCDIYDGVKRVLKKSGTCWVNLGDTYSQGKLRVTGMNYFKGNDFRIPYKDRIPIEQKGLSKKIIKINSNIPSKCLMMLPQRFAIEMINRGWILRNVIIWHKPNAMPSSARDRFTVDFEYVYFFVKNKKYWFEQQREPYQESTLQRAKYSINEGKEQIYKKTQNPTYFDKKSYDNANKKILSGVLGGKNKRTVWTIPTKPNPEAHFATFPPKLIEPMIKAGCPEYICIKCGKPRKKIIKTNYIGKRDVSHEKYGSDNVAFGCNQSYGGGKTIHNFKGYTDCGCGKGFEPGIVLDIFFGTGTTLKEAWKLGRNYIGFEISKEYCEIANRNLSFTKNKRLDVFI